MLSDFYNLLLYIITNPKLIVLSIFLLVTGGFCIIKYSKKRLSKKLQHKEKLSVNSLGNTGSTYNPKPTDRNYIPEHHTTHSTAFTIDSVSQVFESKEHGRGR
ncbi:hypothetical protein EDL79_00680 [Ehrlichia ruminantium]|uniref:Uncharacterized protein n=1 Tax=Ehrlichia ruminantium TaxID=779 RepID=A0AAE6UIA0_EHRRU|nr:hypothetical protein [Ehrlichia ruminantium]QGR02210.1 hypothetical protein EDL81_00680 [Ehrlichia ruminantium]QGR03132.1 hypothetical protein EDL80_00680 [Ehrlichia ruminantium]QGR04057.1 hypothetical protein EDL79_00680 [Ehrlichia ruminantium]